MASTYTSSSLTLRAILKSAAGRLGMVQGPLIVEPQPEPEPAAKKVPA